MANEVIGVVLRTACIKRAGNVDHLHVTATAMRYVMPDDCSGMTWTPRQR
ncbi:hypothetical protein LL963_13940 [Xanthomonas campestris pv. esculenti]|nr:hypothetical protein [Xanthomonas campestris pv. esculenti]